jgi:hypothetical protein
MLLSQNCWAFPAMASTTRQIAQCFAHNLLARTPPYRESSDELQSSSSTLPDLPYRPFFARGFVDRSFVDRSFVDRRFVASKEIVMHQAHNSRILKSSTTKAIQLW